MSFRKFLYYLVYNKKCQCWSWQFDKKNLIGGSQPVIRVPLVVIRKDFSGGT